MRPHGFATTETGECEMSQVDKMFHCVVINREATLQNTYF